MKGLSIFLIGIGSLLIIMNIVAASWLSWAIDRDTTAWQVRAQVAADARQIYANLVKCEAGMDKWGFKSGYAAWIFKTPENNMAEIRKALRALADRASRIKKLDKSSTTYQVALDDIRGTLRELDLLTFSYYWRHHGAGYLVWLWVPGWILIVLGILPFLKRLLE